MFHFVPQRELQTVLRAPKSHYCPTSNTAIPCPTGTVTNTEGAEKDCTPCPAGTLLTEGVCVSCPKNYYCPTSNTSIPCPAGAYTATGRGRKEEDCVPCTAGTLYNRTDNGCVQCPKNYYCPTSNTSIPCPAGTITNTEGAEKEGDCVLCPESHYCPGGGAEPRQCKFDQFSNLQACDFDQYKNNYYYGGLNSNQRNYEGYDTSKKNCIPVSESTKQNSNIKINQDNCGKDGNGILPQHNIRLGERTAESEYGYCRNRIDCDWDSGEFCAVDNWCHRLGAPKGSKSASECSFNETVYSCEDACDPGSNCNSFRTPKSYSTLSCGGRGSFKPEPWEGNNQPNQRNDARMDFSPLRICVNCKYKKWCPGGKESSCLFGRSGFGCKDCPERFYNLNDGCAPCPEGIASSFQWLICIVAISAYYAYLYKELGRKQKKEEDKDEQETKATVGPKKARRSSKMGAYEQKTSGGTLARIGILLSHVTSINLILPSISLPHIPPVIKLSFLNFLRFLSVDISGMVTSPECQMEMETETKVHFNACLPLVIVFSCWVWQLCLRRRNTPKGRDKVRQGDDRIVAVLLHIYVVNMYVLILDKVLTPFDCTMKFGTWDEDPSMPCGEIIGRSLLPVVFYITFYIVFPTIYILDNAYGVNICQRPFKARQEYSEDKLLQKERLMKMTKSRRNSWWGKQGNAENGHSELYCCFKHCVCCRRDPYGCRRCCCRGCVKDEDGLCECCNNACKCGKVPCSKLCGNGYCCGCSTKCCSACCIRGCAIFCRGCICCCCRKGCWDGGRRHDLSDEGEPEAFCCACGCCCSKKRHGGCWGPCCEKNAEKYKPESGTNETDVGTNARVSYVDVDTTESYAGCCTWVLVILFFPLGLLFFCCPCDSRKVKKRVAAPTAPSPQPGPQPVPQQPALNPQPVYQQPVLNPQPVYQQPVLNPQPVYQQPALNPQPLYHETETTERYAGCCTWILVILFFPAGLLFFCCPCDTRKSKSKILVQPTSAPNLIHNQQTIVHVQPSIQPQASVPTGGAMVSVQFTGPKLGIGLAPRREGGKLFLVWDSSCLL